MAFIPVPDCVQVYARYTQQGQTCYNVHHFKDTTPNDLLTHQTIAQTYRDWWFNNIRADQSTGLSLNAIFTRSLLTEFAGGIVYTAALPASGLDVRPALPMNVTVAVAWHTGAIGKSYRGRTYHLGLVTGNVTDSTVNAGFVTELTNVYTAMITAFATVLYPMVVVSRFSNKAPRIQGIATPILTCSVDSTTDSQRRRLPGRGR